MIMITLILFQSKKKEENCHLRLLDRSTDRGHASSDRHRVDYNTSRRDSRQGNYDRSHRCESRASHSRDHRSITSHREAESAAAKKKAEDLIREAEFSKASVYRPSAKNTASYDYAQDGMLQYFATHIDATL